MILKLLLATLLLTPTLFAQGSTTYDVSVIHRSNLQRDSTRVSSDTALFFATNATLKTLLEAAYNIRPDLITGIPPALESLRYDFTAKVVDPDMKALEAITKDQRRALLIPVFQDRFALKAHIETKDLPLYELTLPGPARLPPPAPGEGHGVSTSRTSINADHLSVRSLCEALGNIVHKPVIDKTGLTGDYAIHLKWSPDDNTDPNNQDPPLLTALQEQLGLKLKPARGPVPTLVVDHIEAPTEN